MLLQQRGAGFTGRGSPCELIGGHVAEFSGLAREFEQENLRPWRILGRLHRDPVSRDERLQQFNPQELNRIVPCRDDRDVTKGSAADRRLVREREGTAMAQPARSEQRPRPLLDPLARREQRQDVTHQRFERRLVHIPADQFDQFVLPRGERAPKCPGPRDPVRQRPLRGPQLNFIRTALAHAGSLVPNRRARTDDKVERSMCDRPLPAARRRSPIPTHEHEPFHR